MNKLLAGVAALALSAGVANAGTINEGSSAIAGYQLSQPAGAGWGKVANFFSTFGGGDEIASWIDIDGSVPNNSGTASDTDGATFTLKGTVSKDCSFYTGNVNTVLDFGTIGIRTEDTIGVDAAFDMVGAANLEIETNVAGCNTPNNVTITKGNGAVGLQGPAVAFDNAQFTNALPYTVNASWTGVPNAGAGQAGSGQNLVLSTSDATQSKAQGAWKSHFEVDVNIPVPSKSLVAGAYQDTLQIELSAI